MSPEEIAQVENALSKEGYDAIAELHQLYESLDDNEKLEPLGIQLADHIFLMRERERYRTRFNRIAQFIPPVNPQ